MNARDLIYTIRSAMANEKLFDDIESADKIEKQDDDCYYLTVYPFDSEPLIISVTGGLREEERPTSPKGQMRRKLQQR